MTLAIMITGLPSTGKTTIGKAIVQSLQLHNETAHLIDGDELRNRLLPSLGFTREDRLIQASRAIYIAELLKRYQIIPVIALILPFEESRDQAKKTLGPNCLEIYLHASLEICIGRDTRGTYRNAREVGDVNYKSIVDVYEPPRKPDFSFDTAKNTVPDCVDLVLDQLKEPSQSDS